MVSSLCILKLCYVLFYAHWFLCCFMVQLFANMVLASNVMLMTHSWMLHQLNKSEECVNGIKQWMLTNFLLLNSDRTDIPVLGPYAVRKKAFWLQRNSGWSFCSIKHSHPELDSKQHTSLLSSPSYSFTCLTGLSLLYYCKVFAQFIPVWHYQAFCILCWFPGLTNVSVLPCRVLLCFHTFVC